VIIQVRRIEDCNVPSVIASANVLPVDRVTITNFIRYSPCCWVGFVNERFCCMWGLVPPTLLSDTAYLWLFVNELIEEHKFVFVRHSQIQMQKMLDMYPIITGHCRRDHVRSMQWLRWLGAKFDQHDGLVASFTITRD
jgi:hypothetical protein